MALSIFQIIRQFTTAAAKAISPETIEKICARLDYVWRERVLDPTATIHVFLLHIMHGNAACTALSRLAGVSFTATAYCATRARLPLALFENHFLALCSVLAGPGARPRSLSLFCVIHLNGQRLVAEYSRPSSSPARAA
jgi:hypothetical protein